MSDESEARKLLRESREDGEAIALMARDALDGRLDLLPQKTLADIEVRARAIQGREPGPAPTVKDGLTVPAPPRVLEMPAISEADVIRAINVDGAPTLTVRRLLAENVALVRSDDNRRAHFAAKAAKLRARRDALQAENATLHQELAAARTRGDEEQAAHDHFAQALVSMTEERDRLEKDLREENGRSTELYVERNAVAAELAAARAAIDGFRDELRDAKHELAAAREALEKARDLLDKRWYSLAADTVRAALTGAVKLEGEGEVERLRAFVEDLAAVCMRGPGNVSCREVHPNPDPLGLGENRWCWACRARSALTTTRTGGAE